MRSGAFPFIPSIFIEFTSKVRLLVARLRLSDPVALRSGWELVKNAAFPFRLVDDSQHAYADLWVSTAPLPLGHYKSS